MTDLSWKIPAALAGLTLLVRWVLAPFEVHKKALKQADKQISALADDKQELQRSVSKLEGIEQKSGGPKLEPYIVDEIFALDVADFTDENFAELERLIDRAIQTLSVSPNAEHRALLGRLLQAREGVEQGYAPDPHKRPSLEEMRAFVATRIEDLAPLGASQMRCQIVAELATAHGGDVELAADMIRAAADAGADFAKLQTYSLDKLNPRDPQAAWLRQSHLDEAAHVRLLKAGQDCGIEVFSTPFDCDSLLMLRRLGLKRFKIASSESANHWYEGTHLDERWILSWAWGHQIGWHGHSGFTHLTAIPLYPTPLECVERAPLLDGWSDHTEGLSACYRAIALGAKMIEVHLALAGRSRIMAFDKSPTEIRMLRKFAEDCETMRSGVAQKFRERWSA